MGSKTSKLKRKKLMPEGGSLRPLMPSLTNQELPELMPWKNDPNYNMNINLTNKGLTFNTLEFPNRLGITHVDKREKWWKGKESIVTITNSNPYMIVDGITSYTIKKNEKWYQKWWVHTIGGGIIGGWVTLRLLNN